MQSAIENKGVRVSPVCDAQKINNLVEATMFMKTNVVSWRRTKIPQGLCVKDFRARLILGDGAAPADGRSGARSLWFNPSSLQSQLRPSKCKTVR
jgi:hypothetical protein